MELKENVFGSIFIQICASDDCFKCGVFYNALFCVDFFNMVTYLEAHGPTYFGGTVHQLQKAHE